MANPDFRIGVLINPMVLRWQEVALQNVLAVDGVTIEHVVVDASVRDESSTLRQGAEAVNRDDSLSLADLRLFGNVLREEKLKALVYADRKFGWTVFNERQGIEWIQSKPVESVDPLADAQFHECDPVPAGGAWTTLPDDLTRTLGAECDLLLLFGFGLLKGPVLDAPEYGVLSTHGSDIREYRGMGSKIAFLEGAERATVTLQQITEKIDGGNVVEIASQPLPEHPTYADMYEAVKEIQTEIFATGIEKLHLSDFEPWRPDVLGPYHSHRKMEERIDFVARYLLKNNWRRIRQRVPPAISRKPTSTPTDRL